MSGISIFLLLLASGTTSLAAETLEELLRAANIPLRQFPASDLSQKITSYAISRNEPFLLAYYIDDGSGLLRRPLRVVRYDRGTGNLRRAGLVGEVPMNCLGSALDIREHRGTIYLDTHINPSAGCLIVLSSNLDLKTALSGWLLGVIGSDYAILRRSEMHFMSVHPMHIAVYDLSRNQSVELYPYRGDPHRRQFSQLLKPLISQKWCMENNAQCDPGNFDTEVTGKVIVNETSRLFGFRAEFDARGFGPVPEKQVPAKAITYLFRERGGIWEHREFDEQQLNRLLGGMTFDQWIAKAPEAAFHE